MRVIQSLLSAAVLISGISAAPYQSPSVQASGWQGPGTYRIFNAQTRTNVDLFQGKTNVVGWQNDPNSPNQNWVFSPVSPSANTWAIVNSKSRTAVTSNGWNNPVTARPLDPHNPAQLWLIEERGAGGPVVLHSAADPALVLDLSYGNSGNNVPIVLYPKSGRPNQDWFLSLVSRSQEQETWTPAPATGLDKNLMINVAL